MVPSTAYIDFCSSDTDLSILNTSLELIGEFPIPKKKPASRYLQRKIERISDAVNRKIK